MKYCKLKGKILDPICGELALKEAIDLARDILRDDDDKKYDVYFGNNENRCST